MSTLTPYLCAKGASDAIEFYKTAFDAEEKYRITQDDGRVGHAELVIYGVVVYLSDEWPEMGVLSPTSLKGSSVSFVIDLADVDAAFQRAVDAGAKIERPIAEAPAVPSAATPFPWAPPARTSAARGPIRRAGPRRSASRWRAHALRPARAARPPNAASRRAARARSRY